MLSLTTVTQLAVTISLGFSIYLLNAMGAQSQQLNNNAVTVAKVQQQVDDMDQRTARIETKVDMLLKK